MQPGAAKKHGMSSEQISYEMMSVWKVGAVCAGQRGLAVVCAVQCAPPPMLGRMHARHAYAGRSASSWGVFQWHHGKKWRIPRPHGAEMATYGPVPFHTGALGRPPGGARAPKFDERGRHRCVMAQGCAT
jgi:hypothetical protein